MTLDSLGIWSGSRYQLGWGPWRWNANQLGWGLGVGTPILLLAWEARAGIYFLRESRVDQGGFPPQPPSEPDVQISRIRLLQL